MKHFTDVSLDLETLGTKPGSVITQIGACAFNADEPWWDSDTLLTQTYMSQQIFIDPNDCAKFGMQVEWDTIKWWMEQSEEARKALCTAVGVVGLFDALQDLTSFIRLHCRDDFRVWGYGANFDVVLLEDAFKRINRQPPWGYRQVMCGRTLVRQVEGYPRPAPRVAHIAEADAVAQAHWIADCRNQIHEALCTETPVTAIQPAPEKPF